MDKESGHQIVTENFRAITEIRFPGCRTDGKVKLGLGVLDSIGQEARALGGHQALLIADPVLKTINKLSYVVKLLEKEGLDVSCYTDISPEPDINTLDAVEKEARGVQYDIVIGIGGGSTMDLAKIAACLTETVAGRTVLYHIDRVKSRCPLMLLPTTSGTGSEVSPYSVVSENGVKHFASSPLLYANLALIDPMLTVSMPPRVTAFTGMDALTHGIEGVCGCTNPYTMAMAGKCVELVFSYLPRAVKDSEDLEARWAMSFASMLGMMAYTQGGGLYAHSMSYILTEEKHLPHGTGCGLALPYTLKANRQKICPVLEMTRNAIGASQQYSPQNIDDTIGCFKMLQQDINLPGTLQELGYTEDGLPSIAHKLMDVYYRPRNPRKLEFKDALEMVQNMYQGIL